MWGCCGQTIKNSTRAAAGKPRNNFFFFMRAASSRPKTEKKCRPVKETGRESEPSRARVESKDIPAVAGCVHRGRTPGFKSTTPCEAFEGLASHGSLKNHMFVNEEKELDVEGRQNRMNSIEFEGKPMKFFWNF